MKKIAVIHHSNQFGLGGTEKDMLLFLKYMDKSVFDVHAIARKHPVPLHRVYLDRIRGAMGSRKARYRLEQYRVSSIRAPDFVRELGEERVHYYTPGSLAPLLKKLSPQILHVHHSGVSEPPISSPDAVGHIPLIFTINGFGFQDTTEHDKRVNKILFPSYFIQEKVALWGKNDPRCGVLYCPIEKPHSNGNLRAELSIKENIFVIGRVGRNADDIHDPISLKAYKKIENENTLFLALAPPPNMVRDAKELGIKNIRFLEPTVDEVWLSKFYNTIDVLAHARTDGETFGCVIAEAMIHARPVVTHLSHLRNAQAELVQDGISGFVAPQHDFKAYAGHLRTLMSDRQKCKTMGQAALKRALENFEAGLITKKLEKMYLEELKKRGIAS
ncbi:MAG: hypothetical protein A2901_04925 [Elusimicrobia bacterium RIFCSPLOWO2_01_FULL_54_10]|nr:MAG: hypothetical protein A2901_04925 [Elusimicrobia bacterium RIFCSPLOWO2_01_FULL_54_10]